MTSTLLVVPAVGQTISYVEFTTDVTISATTEATANTIVTAAAFTPNGVDAYWIEFFAPGVSLGTSTGAQILIDLYDNGSAISAGASVLAQFVNPAAAAFINSCDTKRRIVPTNAAHTYSIRGHRVTANGTVNGTGGATTQPGFIRITKGP